MYRVSAKVAQKVGMLLQHEGRYTGASKQKAGHHPGWTAADNHEWMLGSISHDFSLRSTLAAAKHLKRGHPIAHGRQSDTDISLR